MAKLSGLLKCNTIALCPVGLFISYENVVNTAPEMPVLVVQAQFWFGFDTPN
jgi:hypothetical protein